MFIVFGDMAEIYSWLFSIIKINYLIFFVWLKADSSHFLYQKLNILFNNDNYYLFGICFDMLLLIISILNNIILMLFK